ncbi:MAG: hypothetical protein HFJ05_04920 [Eubacterium sp.]|nr:hypothetical protein [Eubacterium sp.]
MVKSMALAVLFLVVLPFLLGLFYTGFAGEDGKSSVPEWAGVNPEKENILLHVVTGYIIMFGVFWLVALPLVWMRQSLSLLIWIYSGILLLTAVISLVSNRKRLVKVLTHTVLSVKGYTLCIWAQLMLILGQVFLYLRYQYANADDAFFVASATTSLATDTVFAFNPYTGAAYTKLPARYVLSPFHAFTATAAKLTGIHPAVMAHVVFMIVFLLLAYAVYTLIGRMLFGKDMEKTGYFLVLVSALLIFSAYSERTGGLFLLIRLWQGKAILAGVLLPLVFYMAVRTLGLMDGTGRAGVLDWVLLFLLMCACCAVSSMGVILGAIMFGILGILAAAKQKNLRLLAYSVCCCLPNILCGGLYLWMR